MALQQIRIRGGRPLRGEIAICGAKNAALPLMTAGMLTDDRLVLGNVPGLADIDTMAALIAQHGVSVEPAGRELSIGGPITNIEAPYDIVRKMRASVLVLGPLLARCGEARVSLPGGCAIGTRPVDIHLTGFEAMGAAIRIEGGYIHASVPGRLRGAEMRLAFASVGATQSLLMAATLASGRTVIANAAREPEIVDLADCLTAMGARTWAARAERELAATGPTGTGDADALTPRERDVCDLVAAGHTNREVAAALFLSPRTVEHHLRVAYRKLGVRSRTELAARHRRDG